METTKAKFSKLKVAFLYVLVGGLVISALISVAAILIGEFNEVIQKALGTTLSLVVSSLLVLAIITADKHNTLGKSIILTTILGVILINMVISTLGIWEVISGSDVAKAYSMYILTIGAAFAITGAQQLRIPRTSLVILTYVTVGAVALLALLIAPWLLVNDSASLAPLYYRLIAAVAVIAATLFVVTAIIQRVVIGQHPELKPSKQSVPGGIIAIYVTTGVIVLWVWMAGFVAFTSQAARINEPEVQEYYQEPKYEDDYTPYR